jgi:hypothetical protein
MTAMSPPIHIANHEKVVEAFGYWPLFHDAEVRSLKLDRNRTLFDATANPCVELVIHALEWTEAKGSAPASFNHHLVHFEFEEIDDVQLIGFNHQNALHGLRFEPAEAGPGEPRHWLAIDSAHGLIGGFTYARATVVAVTPCSDQGAPRW